MPEVLRWKRQQLSVTCATVQLRGPRTHSTHYGLSCWSHHYRTPHTMKEGVRPDSLLSKLFVSATFPRLIWCRQLELSPSWAVRWQSSTGTNGQSETSSPKQQLQKERSRAFRGAKPC